MKSVGFKEWSVVCEALGRGLQSIILRKGGIAEGRAGFSFQQREFFLFPTHFHEQLEKVRQIDIGVPEQDELEINLKYFSRIEEMRVIRSWPVAEALESLHILQREVVQERFEDDRAPGIHVAFVRVFRVEPVWTIPCEKKYGGCRSWVNLPGPRENLQLHPVLGEDEHERNRCAFAAAICRGN
jgi:hypothetical protein